MWFVGDPARLERERAAVAALMSGADWLLDVDWRLTADGRVKLDFAIVVRDRLFALRMTYPKLFPFTPPEVAPVGEDRRLSAHQYGDETGNLCLQHRPDNWVPTVTGADMIRSAYELLSTERPADGPAREVPSDHRLTEAQEFRNKSLRLLVPAEMRRMIGRLVEGVGATAEVGLRRHPQCTTAAIDKVCLPEGEWRPTNFPKIGVVYKGVLVRVTAIEYQAIIDDPKVATAWRDRVAGDLALAEHAEKEFLLATDGERVTLAWQLSSDKEDIAFFAPLPIDGNYARLPAGYHALAPKKVAIVGCGSAGSKIAISLARSGVGSFLLVDDGLFLRDNFVRHDLDWRNVGEHKADGVARRIRGINPGADITIRRLKLSGQESAASAASALEQIAGCVLIVDATADPHAFNLLASVCATSKKPMVWLEVFAGGIGGFVARHFPAVDAKPQIMRNAYNNWCRSQAVPWTDRAAGAYASEPSEGPVLVADDADVAVVTAHAARMAIDALIDGQGFPHSMYVISLRAGWVFDQPFEAYPIDAQAPAEEPDPEADPEEKSKGFTFSSMNSSPRSTMKLLLPDVIENQMKRELRLAGRREIGGVLLGEFVRPGVFRVAEITVQRTGGTSSTFVRIPRLHADAIKAFFERTGHGYERFNYLGEWHSHPSYPTRPSGSDVRAMEEILRNPVMAVNFAVLSIVKSPAAGFEISSYAFVRGTRFAEIATVSDRIATRKKDWRSSGRAPLDRVETSG